MSRPTRRTLLATATGLLAGCGSRARGRERARGKRRSRYGTAHSAQFGDLYLPASGDPHGWVVVLHGGFWQATYGLDLGSPLANDLASKGYLAWNLEYRRLGDGGGWPSTFTDVAAGIDHLRELTEELDLPTRPTVAIGHSAGGQLAVWAAGRHRLPASAVGADPALRLDGVVAQAGVLDLETAALQGIGGTAAADLVGGPPDEQPQRYALASPIRQLPIDVPACCVHGPADSIVPIEQSRSYVRRARAAGDPVSLYETDGDHFTLIDPTSPDWAAVLDRLPELLDGAPR